MFYSCFVVDIQLMQAKQWFSLELLMHPMMCGFGENWAIVWLCSSAQSPNKQFNYIPFKKKKADNAHVIIFGQ